MNRKFKCLLEKEEKRGIGEDANGGLEKKKYQGLCRVCDFFISFLLSFLSLRI